jgi:HD-GYP domain-containing protein (c-di-GMP phosphodiesterase class II)
LLRVEVRNAKPGMKLALPVRHPRNFEQILLRVNYTLEPHTIERLGQMSVHSIWVRYPKLDFLSRVVSEQVLRAHSEVVRQVGDVFDRLQKDASAKLPIDTYTQAITDMVDKLMNNPQAAVFMGDLATDGDDLLRHSAAVSYLSLLMALKLEVYVVRQRKHIDAHRAKEVVNCGIGAMLHDIGIPQLDQAVRQRYQDSGDEADAAWREHPRLGYELVRGRIEPSAATVVLNHHQRVDGTGYAGGATPVLAGSRIHIFARIVGLADQFDRLRHPAGQPAQPTVAVLGGLLEPKVAAAFDPQVLRALFTVVPPYPPGSMVRLSDGRWAAVIDHHPADPCRPAVQIVPPFEEVAEAATPDGEAHSADGQIIDLSECEDTVRIVDCDGFETSGFNFPAPAIMSGDAAVIW